MYNCGLLLLVYRSKKLSNFLNQFGHYLKKVNTRVTQTLYISLEEPNFMVSRSPAPTISSSELIKLIPSIYVQAHRYVPSLDVRVLHHIQYHKGQLAEKQPFGKRKLCNLPDVFVTNEPIEEQQHFDQMITNRFDIKSKPILILKEQFDNFSDSSEEAIQSNLSDRTFDYVCLGGTFDCMHNGHKVLLSSAQLKCQKCLTIGVTDVNMVRKKTLWELIDTPEKRIADMRAYLVDVDPFIDYQLTKLTDPFGPAIVDRSLESIIVSEETIRGGKKINEIRKEKKMPALVIDVVKLLDDTHREHEVEESKVSSSSLRLRKLGTLLKEPEPRPNLPSKPYLIGLTGLVASGKSSISQKLSKLGAGIINVDLLAHKVYQNHTQPAYKEIVKEFGNDIVNEKGDINRYKLGEIVFSDNSKLQRLNQIVWPRVEQLVSEEIAKLAGKFSVIMLEVALLIESNWLDKVHQVWLTILDEKEAIIRLQRRNQLSEAESIKRVNSMGASHEKVDKANVVFCTQWEENFTWKQVNQAWRMLQEKGYIPSQTSGEVQS